MNKHSSNNNAIAILGTLTALTASSQAAVVQISLVNNQISSGGGNFLNADVTGDLLSDVSLSNTNFSINPGIAISSGSVFISVNGQVLRAFGSIQRSISRNGPPSSPSYISFTVDTGFNLDAEFATGGVGTSSTFGASTSSIRYLNPISFTDVRINGGAITEGWLEVNAFRNSTTDQNVVFTRVIFDDADEVRPFFEFVPGAQTEWVANAVPEPSSLGLLALGAGGLLARRRRHAAA